MGQNLYALHSLIPFVHDQTQLTELQELFLLEAMVRKNELEEEYMNSVDSGSKKSVGSGKTGVSDADARKIEEFKRFKAMKDAEKNK